MLKNVFNITGLSIGVAVTLLTGLWIVDECSYDRYNEHYDKVARVMQTGTVNGEVGTGYGIPIPVAAVLRNNYGRYFRRVALSQWTRDHILSVGDKKFTEPGKFMEEEGPEILSLPMLEGIRAGLKDPAACQGDWHSKDIRRLGLPSVAAVVGGFYPAGGPVHPYRGTGGLVLYASLATALCVPCGHILVDICGGGVGGACDHAGDSELSDAAGCIG
ncbi:MAG TPA: hypothetical protein VHC96_21160 [Puia sp.]|nr:hypothetical protein [Puia sp.]